MPGHQHQFASRIGTGLLLGAMLVALAGCGSGSQPAPTTPVAESPPIATSPAPQTAPGTTSATAPEAATLGPDGVGALKLGMSKAEAEASGLVTGVVAGSDGTCGGPEDGSLKGGASPDGDDIAGRLFFSATTGKLVAIYAHAGIATPEGIGLGSTQAELVAAHSDWQQLDSEPGWVAVPDNPQAHYRISIVDDRVFELSLDSNDQDCYE